MARVYLGTQNSLDRRVALKVMAPALVADPSFSKRFMLEARTLAGLTHPNIVAVYDVGATDQLLHYFAMQHLDNGDLAMRIRHGLPETELVRILTAIAKALGFAHTRGVVHRDVTPGNIMFDSANNPVLTDFGIARSQHGASKITHTGVSIGTSSYMSPEQARGGEVDRRSDLYSLGSLAFEALTGHPPYQGSDGFAVAYAHVFEPIPRLPRHLEHWQLFLDKALAKDPNERFDNADQFAVALSDVPVQATRIVPQRTLASAVHTTALPQLKPDTPAPGHVSAPAAPIAQVSQQSIEQIKKQLQAQTAKPVVKTAGSAEASSKRGLWLSLASLAALLLAGGGYWLHHRDTSFDPVVPTPSAPIASEPTLPTSTPIASAPALPSAFDPPPDDGSETEATPLPLDPLPSQYGPITRAQWSAPIITKADSMVKNNQCFITGGAVNLYRLVLSEERANAKALAGFDTCFKTITAKADAFLAAENPDAVAFKNEAITMDKFAKLGGEKAKERALIQTEVARVVKTLLERGAKANSEWRPKAAAKVLGLAATLDENNGELKKALALAGKIGRPGYVFGDNAPTGKAPSMVIIGTGSVTMKDARGGSATIRINKPFAVSRNEVNFAEFSAFAKATGHRISKGCNNLEGFALINSKERTWQKPGFDVSARSPVSCISFEDAQRYVAWLNKRNDGAYRLLSEAEWHFLAKAAPAPRCKAANLADQDFGTAFEKRKTLACSDGFGGAAPTGSFGTDANGVADLTGNVREWVEDCWNASLAARPTSQAAWTAGNCKNRVAMGTSFASDADETQITIRKNFGSDDLYNTVGFRVARELPASLNEE